MRKRKFALAAALALACLPAPAADRVLIMTISEYGNSPHLDGTRKDAQFARDIARRLGFDAAQARVVAERGLTVEGMRAELKALREGVQAGDRVMVYFSGHGSSYRESGQCVQALYAQDEKPLPARELNDTLNAVRSKADALVVLLDSCFSGGVAQLGALRGRARLRSKFVPIDACGVPANEILPQTLQRSARNLEQNFTYVAAAAENESAFDSDDGGLATQAVDACLAEQSAPGGPRPVIAFDELARCAQRGVEQKVNAVPGFLPPHIQLVGTPQWAIATPAAAIASAANAAPGTVIDGLLIEHVMAQREGAWSVGVDAQPRRLRIGQDELRLTVTTSRSGYLYVLVSSSDGMQVSQIYPAAPRDAQEIAANRPFRLPTELASRGPAGTDRILVLVTSRPQGPAADLSAGKAPANAYGAALVEVVEQ